MRTSFLPVGFTIAAVIFLGFEQQKGFTESHSEAGNESAAQGSGPLMRPCVAPTEGTKAWGNSKSFWLKKHDFTVKFLDGDAPAQEKVKKAVKAWEDAANIHWHWVDSGNADIRISFSHTEGHWSKVGTSALNVPQARKTMNLALAGSDSQSEFNRVARHEFGHALGLQHEHQHPAFKIDWNKERVYAWYAKDPNDWDKRTVDEQVFALYTGKYIGTAPDKDSIMMYPILPGWAKNIAVGWNRDLSAADKQFIAERYGPPQHTTDLERPTPGSENRFADFRFDPP
jgi:hypothetical protein